MKVYEWMFVPTYLRNSDLDKTWNTHKNYIINGYFLCEPTYLVTYTIFFIDLYIILNQPS